MSRLVFGIQPVREAIRVHGSGVDRLWLERDAGPKLDALGRFAEGRGIPIERLPRSEMDRKAGGGRHQGAIASVPSLRLVDPNALGTDPSALIVVLDGIMDPQNFGAIIRSAVALGATAIMWPEHSSAPLSPATFRASAGAIEHAMLCRVTSLPDALKTLTERGVTSIALDASAQVELGALDLRRPIALIVGAEDKGPRRTVLRACEQVARLPMAGPMNSLNASVAAGIALYEVARQRARTAAT